VPRLAEDPAVALRRASKPDTRLRSDSVAAQLKEMILSGELKPGDRLPPEADLCRHFGVSRITIREATQVLKGLGLLEATPGRGTFVAHRDPGAVLRDLARFSFDSVDQIADAYEVRIVIETRAAAQAAARAESADREALLAFTQKWLAAAADSKRPRPETFRTRDLEFHLRVAHLSGNILLEEVNERLVHVLDAMRRRSLSLQGRALLSWQEHEKIALAIAAGDSDAAGAAATHHIASVATSILEADYGAAAANSLRLRRLSSDQQE
jgi:GntR family transcriptional regulator, transcriptional repressor for pyruvate dehydrogenase complex